jgi:hypothetical protein
VVVDEADFVESKNSSSQSKPVSHNYGDDYGYEVNDESDDFDEANSNIIF